MKPIHILTADATAGVICAELARLGQVASWGPDPSPAAKYTIVPHAAAGPAQADRLTEDDILRAVRNAHDADVDSLRTAAFTVKVRRPPPAVVQQEKGDAMLVRLPDGTRLEAVPTGTAPSRSSHRRDPQRARVVHVMPWDLTVGGAQRMLDLWCTAEHARWDIHIVTGSRVPPVWPFPGATLHQGVCSPQALADLCDRLRPDVVVQHYCGATIAPGAAAWPQVWIVHGDRVTAAPKPQHAEPRTCFLCHPPTPEYHPSWAGTRFRPRRLSVDTDRYRPAEARPPREHPVVGIVARLAPEKVPWPFVEALTQWEPGPWRLRFVGEGIRNDYQPRVKAALGNLPWVEFAGDVATDGMPDAYRDLDALLVPSSTECGSYAIAEGMACGLPIVARRVGGIPFTSGERAILCETDAELLAGVRSLDAACARQAAGTASRQWATSALNLGHFLAAHTAAYAAAATPRVSILVPVWNTPAEYLRECWESILAQTMPLWELVLVDDGSDDPATLAVLAEIAAADVRVRRLTCEHRGIAASLNDGLAACRSNLVARMDSDDVMVPDRLARQLAAWDGLPHDTAVLGGQIDWLGLPGRSRTCHPAAITRQIADNSNWFVNHPATMLNRAAVQAVGGYDPAFPRVQDLDLWLRLHETGFRLANMPDVLVHYRTHPAQDSKGINGDAIAALRAARAERLRRAGHAGLIPALALHS